MKFITAILIGVSLLPSMAFAQSTQPSIALKTDIEDGKQMVQATVTAAGKPKENVTLQFFAQRTFGNILLGEDTTLDDGTAAVAFPADLPAATDGQIHITAKIKTPEEFSSISSSAAFPAGVKPTLDDPFPRALWAPHAPVVLLVCIGAIVAGVWLSYAFVVAQVFVIWRSK
jgi:hypothetical protein